MSARHRTAARHRTRRALLLLVLVGCARPAPRLPAPEAEPGDVRVGVAVRVGAAALQCRGAWRLHAGDEARDLPVGAAVQARVREGRVEALVDGVVIGSDPRLVRLLPTGASARLLLGDVPYAGRFALRADAGSLTVVEEIGLEAYLRGVVPWEIGRLELAALAAVEAQAIAARTYTVARLGAYAAQGFDVYADERDQVYKGDSPHDPLADRAVEATRGQVLTYHGTLVQAYYSSTCGGHSAWIENVWSKPAAPYLRGQRDAAPGSTSFCRDSRHFRWTEAWSGAQCERVLRETLPRVLGLPAGTRIGPLVDLRVAARDPSARVVDLEVRTADGTYHVHGDAIRWVLRPAGRPLLRSLMFDLQLERAGDAIVRVVARGGGNGHGVGMCQSGAIGMARAGYDVQAILQHYYPGTELGRWR